MSIVQMDCPGIRDPIDLTDDLQILDEYIGTDEVAWMYQPRPLAEGEEVVVELD